MVKYGYLYQGQRYKWQKARRGTLEHRPAPGALRQLHAKPRPGGEFALRAAHPRSRRARRAARHDGAAAARAEYAHAFPRPGVCRLRAVSLLRRSQAGAGEDGGERAARSFSSNFRASPAWKTKLRRLVSAPERKRPFSAASSTTPSGRRTRSGSRFITTCSAAPRQIRVSRACAAHGVDGAVLGTQAFVLRFFHDEGDRLLVHQSRRRSSPGPRAGAAPRAAAGLHLEDALDQRMPAVRRLRHAGAGYGRKLAHPGTRRGGPRADRDSHRTLK